MYLSKLILMTCILVLPAFGIISHISTFQTITDTGYLLSAYPLGTVNASTSIRFSLSTLKNKAINNPYSVGIRQTSTLALVGSLSKSCGNNPTCTGTFLIPASGDYQISVYPQNPSKKYYIPFKFDVTSFPGAQTYPGNPLEKQLLKITELRIGRFFAKIFYLSQKTIVNVSISPFAVAPDGFILNIYGTNLDTFSYDTSQSPVEGTITFTGNTQRGSFELMAGYYILAIFDPLPANTYMITWQADSYDCPYDFVYVDYYKNFESCLLSNQTQNRPDRGLPCTAFDKIKQQCTKCLNGYTLDPNSGSCKANTTCSPRFYYHFGNCLPVDDKCKDFDPFTGDCLSCSNNASTLSNGKCTLTEVICANRQWKSGNECRNVSDLCSDFDPANGNCLSCKNTSQWPVNGSCISTEVLCPSGTYLSGSQCMPILSECFKFDESRQVCLSCVQGYFVQDGRCQRVVCPPNQFPSRFGLFCIDVSPLCDSFDTLTGACLSCKQPNQRVDAEGQCVRTVSPLSGCKQRERLGFGKCLNAERNCKAYNLLTEDCDQCEQGFYIDFTGHCEREIECGGGKLSVNGECFQNSRENCLKADGLGLCLQCVNRDYRLEGGQCVWVKRCEAAQYLNAGGECVDVSPDCGLFNPSDGLCVTCKSGADPQLGHCCAVGLIFNGTICVNSSEIQQKINDECVSFHPYLGYCVGCNPGFVPDFVTQQKCVQQ